MKLTNNGISILDKIYNNLKVKEYLDLNAWSEENIVLKEGASSRPGRFKMDLTPFFKPVAEALSPHTSYKEIVVMKGSQVGASQIALNLSMYSLDYLKDSVMYMLPTESLCGAFSKTKLEPAIKSISAIQEALGERGERKSKNTIDYKELPGRFLKLAHAQSANSYSMYSVGKMIIDEYDRYPHNVEGEGDPKSLITNRAITFDDRKIFLLSTPTILGESLIESEFLKTDQNHWHVPCPHCNQYQELIFENFIFYYKNKGNVNHKCVNDENIEDVLSNQIFDAQYPCLHCGVLIEEKHKYNMSTLGKFVPHCLDNVSSDKIGFFVNCLYSSLGITWVEIVRKYIDIRKNSSSGLSEEYENTAQGFYNTILGLPYKNEEKIKQLDHILIESEAKDKSSYFNGEIPEEVVYITIGGDVQRGRAEFEIKGWGKDARTSYSIDYIVIHFDTTSIKEWNDNFSEIINQYVNSTNKNGEKIAYVGIFIDSGGHDWTATVYHYCDLMNKLFIKNKSNSFIYPIKGASYPSKESMAKRNPDLRRSSTRLANVEQPNERYPNRDITFYLINTTKIKDDLMWEIDNTEYWNFPKDRDSSYYKMLASEERVDEVDKRTGLITSRYKRKWRKNESLDANCYALAANYFIRKFIFKDESILISA